MNLPSGLTESQIFKFNHSQAPIFNLLTYNRTSYQRKLPFIIQTAKASQTYSMLRTTTQICSQHAPQRFNLHSNILTNINLMY